MGYDESKFSFLRTYWRFYSALAYSWASNLCSCRTVRGGKYPAAQRASCVLKTFLKLTPRRLKIPKCSNFCSLSYCLFTISEFSLVRGLRTLQDGITSYAVQLSEEKVAVFCFKNTSVWLQMIRKIQEFRFFFCNFCEIFETFRSRNVENVQKLIEMVLQWASWRKNRMLMSEIFPN